MSSIKIKCIAGDHAKHDEEQTDLEKRVQEAVLSMPIIPQIHHRFWFEGKLYTVKHIDWNLDKSPMEIIFLLKSE